MRALRGFMNILLLLALTFSLACFPVTAEDSMEALIPVSCSGAPCTAVLLDAAGETELARLKLEPQQEVIFSVPCDDLREYSFVLKLIDQDTDEVSYDKTVYLVTVTTYQDLDQTMGYVITAKSAADPDVVLGDVDGKPSRLEFENAVAQPDPKKIHVTVSDLCVRKTVVGNPKETCAFSFVLRPLDPAYPMPVTSTNGASYVSIEGVGKGTFESITFKNPGVYEYSVNEVSDSTKPYRYDGATYTVRFVITQNGGILQEASRTLIKNGVELTDAQAVAEFAFQNTYSPSTPHSTPKTGDDTHYILWRDLAFSSLAGMVLVLILLALNHRKAKLQM